VPSKLINCILLVRSGSHKWPKSLEVKVAMSGNKMRVISEHYFLIFFMLRRLIRLMFKRSKPEWMIGDHRPTCTKFGQSILRKIFKFVATRWHLLGLKCTKFDFGCMGSAPNPTGGAWKLSPLPQAPWLDLRGLLLRGEKKKEKRGEWRGTPL